MWKTVMALLLAAILGVLIYDQYVRHKTAESARLETEMHDRWRTIYHIELGKEYKP